MKYCYNCFQELRDTDRICPSCGMGADISNAEQYPHALPCGSVLAGRYVTGRVLGQGGFGITYAAQNYRTKELTAIKEYYPDSMAIREGSYSVTPYNTERSSNYEYGKERFLEEAKTLSEFIGNPHIVRVISCFEENGTAYFVMEYVKGISLKKHLRGKGGRISWQEAMQLLTPVMDALSSVHEKGIIHRDVTPDNIVISDDGSVKLLDFGSARYSIGERSQSLDVILKHGFAPYEQYIHRSRQGSFTDVYSLAATFYFAVTGTAPPEAVERIDNDALQLPSAMGIDIPAGVETALLKAMAVRADDRIRTMAEFKKALVEGAADTDRTEQDTGPGRKDRTGHGENVSISTVTQDGSVRTKGGSDEKKKEDGTALSETPAAPDQAAPYQAALDQTAPYQAAPDQVALDQTAPDQSAPAEGQDTSSKQNREIDLTQYARNKNGQKGSNGKDQQKKLPKWLIPAAAAAAAAIVAIVMSLSGRFGGTGTENGDPLQAAAGAAGAQATGTQASGAKAEDELSPEIRELLSKAEADDLTAQYELGKLYFDGSGVEQNYDEALAWYTKAAEQGSTDAQFDLGEIYYKGNGTGKDDTQALKYYRMAAEKGHAPAQTKTGIMLQTGEGTDRNEEEAFAWFQKAADQEDPEGEYYLGMIYLNGIGEKSGENEDAEAGTVADTDAETDLDSAPDASADADQMQDVEQAGLSFDGIDYDKAVELFTKAAARDLPEAQNALGDCCRDGIGTEQNFEDAFTWYTKAAEQGLPEAQFNLAETYAEGRGVGQSDEQAAAWYTSAAEQDLAKAQTNLGVLYAQGKGVTESEDEAFGWFEKAAEQEDPAGQLDLAYMYLTGTGTEQDNEKAFMYLVKAAENEEADSDVIGPASLTIAQMYDKGIGIEKNEKEAAAWRENAEDYPFAQELTDVFDSSRLVAQKPEYLNSMLDDDRWVPAPEYDTDWR